jgi:hypothetical protein
MGGRDAVEGILRKMLQDLFEADSQGARREKLARAHGYADGYMRAMLDLGVTTQKDLLALVLEERQRSAGASGTHRRARVITSTARSRAKEATA